jgi:F0F1-type ATP synthase membrane subunit b/b'
MEGIADVMNVMKIIDEKDQQIKALKEENEQLKSKLTSLLERVDDELSEIESRLTSVVNTLDKTAAYFSSKVGG